MGETGDERIELESQPLNSSVKIEIVTNANKIKEKPLPIGLTKEELMKYANDPFWCKLRKTLFALFWLLWLAMFLGAFLIIHYVPSCPASSKLRWYQRGAYSEMDMRLFDSRLTGLLAHMDTYSKAFGFDNWLLPAPFECDSNRKVLNLHKIDQELGSIEDFSRIVSTLKVTHKVNVLVDLDLSSTSVEHEWFKRFLANDAAYADFYVKIDDAKKFKVNDNDYQLRQLDQSGQQIQILLFNGNPVLNLKSDRLFVELENSLRYWTAKGVRGFRLLNAPFVIPSLSTNGEVIAYTVDDELNRKFVAQLSSLVKSLMSDAVLLLKFKKEPEPQQSALFYGTETEPIADVVVSSLIADMNKHHHLNGNQLQQKLNDYLETKPKWNGEAALQGPWTGWLIENIDENQKLPLPFHCFNNVLGYLIPKSAPITHVSSKLLFTESVDNFWTELNQRQANGTLNQRENLRLFHQLNQLRADNVESVLLGSIRFPFVDDRVFTMARFSSTSGLLMLANLDQRNPVEFQLNRESYLPVEGKVQFMCESSRLSDETVALDGNVSLRGGEVLIVRFEIA